MSEGQIQKISIFDHLIVHSELYTNSEFIIFLFTTFSLQHLLKNKLHR